MVGTFGMSDILGPLAYDKQGGGQFLGNGNNPRRSVSDATAQAIDKEVRDLVDDAHETALNILRNNLPLLEEFFGRLIQEAVNYSSRYSKLSHVHHLLGLLLLYLWLEQ